MLARWRIWSIIVIAITTSDILITLCATMNILLNHILLRKRMVPFTTSIGLKRDTTMAGNKPDSKEITKEERYFQHFKGGKYKFIHSAFDSETQERMVVYQALYGDQAYWVRPEDMFFGKVTRDGRTFNRFTEIDKF